MNRISISISLALCIFTNSSCVASPPDSTRNLASVSLIQLDHKTSRFLPLSEQGFVVVAIESCSFLVNDRKTTLKAGQYQTSLGSKPLSLSESEEVPVSIVLVRVMRSTQNLTFESTSLAAHQVIEDASSRNPTLIIATAPLELMDAADEADEGEPWRSSPQKMIKMKKGQFVWLAPGMHRLKNTGNGTADFVNIEW